MAPVIGISAITMIARVRVKSLAAVIGAERMRMP
jgi:hypothetical protein